MKIIISIFILYLVQTIMPSLDHNSSLGHRKRRKIKFTFYSHNIWTLDFLPYDYGIVFNHTYRIYQWWLLASTVPFDLNELIDDIFIYNMVVLKRPKKPPDILLRLLCIISIQVLSSVGLPFGWLLILLVLLLQGCLWSVVSWCHHSWMSIFDNDAPL